MTPFRLFTILVSAFLLLGVIALHEARADTTAPADQTKPQRWNILVVIEAQGNVQVDRYTPGGNKVEWDTKAECQAMLKDPRFVASLSNLAVQVHNLDPNGTLQAKCVDLYDNDQQEDNSI